MNIGLFSPCSPGHLYPILALAKEISSRGYYITYFGILDAKQYVEDAQISFVEYASKECPVGTVPSLIEKHGQLTGVAAAKMTLAAFRNSAQLTFKYLPNILKSKNINFLIIDQCSIETEVVAKHLGIPYITVCNALNLYEDSWIPPANTTWKFNQSALGILRNKISYQLLNILGFQFKQDIYRQLKIWNLPIVHGLESFGSRLLQIGQQPKEFDFPRLHKMKYFRYTGPFINPITRQKISFPYELLSGEPIIYASLGTVQNRLEWLFKVIAEACCDIEAQLVISKGSNKNSIDLTNLPGNPIVVDYAPQYEILQKSALTITHAGMNTTLESLSAGVPMVAIPITNDQPGIASRIDWTGTGIMVPLKKASVKSLRTAIQRVLTEPSFKERAEYFAAIIDERNGLKLAADLIEDVIKKQSPKT
jgi:zeaxanthin glucosyltransferase